MTTTADRPSKPSTKAQRSAQPLEPLLEILRERASLPLEEARALPASFYTSQEIYDLEIEQIWRKSWIHVGRVEELVKPGDYISRDIAGEPLLITRTGTGEIKALSRVCAHRFMDILDGAEPAGNAESFSCPYHKWNYSLEGKLQGASYMNDNAAFQREKSEICLKSFQTSTWQGFVFVNLDPDASPLSTVMDQIEARMGNYDAADWRLVDRINWGVTAANWKLVVDNGREAYHHIGTHGESLEPLWPAHMVDFEPLETTDFFFARMFVSPEAAVGQEDGHYLNPLLLPAAPNLTPFERSNYIVAGIYPGFILVPGPDAMLTISFVPTGPDSHYLELDILAHKTALDDPDLDAKVKEYHDWLVSIQAEDAQAQLGVQRMFTSQLNLEGGPLSHLERAVWTFQRYLAKRLLAPGVRE